MSTPQVIVALLVLVAQPSRFDQLIAQAVEAKKRGDLELTLNLLEEAKEIRASYRVNHNIGAVLEELGRYAEAVAQYRAVVADLETPDDVREAERARVVQLEPKLERAWVVVSGVSGGLELFIDGEPISQAGGEVGASPGAHTMELRDREVIRISRLVLPAGVRTRVELGIATEQLQRDSAVIALGGAGERFSSLAVDGATVRGALGFDEIWTDEGVHHFEVEDRENGARHALDVKLTRGSTQKLLDLFPVLLAGAESGDGSGATAHTSSGGTRIAGTIAGGVALVLGAVAAVMLVGAENDRTSILELPKDGDRVYGLTMREAIELDANADSKTTTGTVLAGSAGVLAVSAVVLWLVDR